MGRDIDWTRHSCIEQMIKIPVEPENIGLIFKDKIV